MKQKGGWLNLVQKEHLDVLKKPGEYNEKKVSENLIRN